MVGPGTIDVSRYAGSVGCLLDRTLKEDEVLGTVWLVGENKAATCAHLVLLYAEHLPALLVRFPASRQECGVSAAAFHPQFNSKQAVQMARKAIASPVPALPLQDHNLVILTLAAQPADLDSESAQQINQELSLAMPPAEKGLSGNLAELDLPLVVQTVSQSRKEGNLVVLDERNRPAARFFLRDGKILHASYKNLINEAAIYQIVSRDLCGNFYFQTGKEPNFPASDCIKRPTDMLLIESHRRLDEIPNMLLELTGVNARYKATAEAPSMKSIPSESQSDLEVLWPHLNGSIPIGELSRFSGLDDYAVFQALLAALRSGQIEEVEAPLYRPYTSLKDLPEMAPALPLSPWDEISSLTVDPISGAAATVTGHLLGSLRPGDPWHLIHDLELGTPAAGSPLFRGGKVIGMHCGALPVEQKAQAVLSNLNQSLWVGSIYDCLHGEGPTLANTARSGATTAGCIKVARIDCPSCGSSSLESSRFCKSCVRRLIQDLEVKEGSYRKYGLLASTVVAAVLLCVGVTMWITRIGPVSESRGGTAPSATPVPAAEPAGTIRLDAKIEQADPVGARWIHQKHALVFHTGDLIRLQVRPLADSFVYVLYQGTTSKEVHLIYPDLATNDIKTSKGAVITIPRETGGAVPRGRIALQGFSVYGPPGMDTMILLATDKRSTLFSNQPLAQKVFQSAGALLDKYPAPSLDVSAKALGGGIFEEEIPGVRTKQIFVTRLRIAHKD